MAVYERDWELTAEGGQDNFYTLDFPHRGDIVRLIAKQVGGEAQGYSLDLYSSQEILPEVQSESSSGAGNPPIDPDLFEIIPTQSVGVGGTKVELKGVEYGYCNRDGTPSVPEKKIYLRITPGGTGTKVFQLVLAQKPPNF